MPHKDPEKRREYARKRWRENKFVREYHKTYYKTWNKDNRDKRKEYERKYAETHPEKIKEKHKRLNKKWRENNPERKKELDKKSRAKCIENYRAYQRNYYHRNIEKVRKYCRDKAREERKTIRGNLDNRIAVAISSSLKGVKRFRKWETLVGYTVSNQVYTFFPRSNSGQRVDNHIHLYPYDISDNDTAYPKHSQC